MAEGVLMSICDVPLEEKPDYGADHIKIFLLEGAISTTGALISAREMARLLGNYTDVTLVLPETAKIAETELVDFDAVHRLPIRPLRRGVKDVVLYLPFLLLAAHRLRRLMVKEGADVLLVNDFYLMQGPLLRLLGYRGRMLTWVRIDPGVFGRMGRVWLALATRASDRIIAVSQHIQHLLPASAPNDLLYDPVSAEFLPAPVSRSAAGFHFVFIGNYIEGKGQDVAIAAMADLLQTFPEARLCFHGGDMGLLKNRNYLASLKQQARILGVEAAVTFGDFASSPRLALEGAFATLNLSRSESFSRTVLEASACGLPVIATRCGGPEEIIDDGRTGLMVPINDARACADAMRVLCQDPELAARMGAAGRERVLQVFGPETFAERLRSLIFGSS
jgi:glycosyltransferase involved in cell wall biosynthesis